MIANRLAVIANRLSGDSEQAANLFGRTNFLPAPFEVCGRKFGQLATLQDSQNMIARTLKWEEDSGQEELYRTTMIRQQGHERQKAKVYENKQVALRVSCTTRVLL